MLYVLWVKSGCALSTVAELKLLTYRTS